jgi:hypothetical protein
MIRKLTGDDKLNLKLDNYYARRIISYYNAYGLDYDFCTFFEISNEEEIYGYILQINALVIIEIFKREGQFFLEEIEGYIKLNEPYRIEAPSFVINYLKIDENYKIIKRTQFELTYHKPTNFDESFLNFNPKLDDVFEILTEGFPNVNNYALWLTENSHRVRRGISKMFLYKNCSTATIIFDIENNILIGQVATKIEARGKGYARELLYWLGYYLFLNGKSATLFALDYRESFYREIGFKEISIENVIQRNDEGKDVK